MDRNNKGFVLVELFLAVIFLGVLISAGFSLIHGGSFFPSFNDLTGTTPGISNDPAGFWQGVWHGFIAVFTLIASLFSNKIGMYEVHNNGSWYNYGFFLGIAGIVRFSTTKFEIKIVKTGAMKES